MFEFKSEAEELRRSLERKNAEISLLREIAAVMNSGLKQEQILNSLVDKIVDIVGIQSCSIMVAEDVGRSLRIIVAKGIPEDVIKKSVFKRGEGVSGLVAQIGEPLLIKDVKNHPHFKILDSHSEYNIGSLLCIPIISNNKIIGVLNLTDKRGGFIDDDIELFSTVADQIAVVLKNTRVSRRPHHRLYY